MGGSGSSRRLLLARGGWSGRLLARVGLGPELVQLPEDLADAVIAWLQNAKHAERCYDLHDGHQNGYSWQEIIDVAERLSGKAVFRAKIPLPLVKLIASLNLVRANVFGGSPMLTPGKVRELTHANWVADNDKLSDETGWLPNIPLEEGLRLTLGL